MILKRSLALAASFLLLFACGQPARQRRECLGSLETSPKVTTVQTVSGPVAGYVDDGVFIYGAS